MKTIKWGIIGTGYICGQFTQSFPFANDAIPIAVLSRDAERADEFAKKHLIPKTYTDINEFLSDDEIDVVYVGTPNLEHAEYTIACLEAGKHVLCEKPMANDEATLRTMLDAAAKADRFLMEGIWSHFFPATLKVREWIDTGKIGKPLQSYVDFSVKASGENWRMDAERGGSALLDVGIYCLTVTSYAFGLKPIEVKSFSYSEKGVDVLSSVIMKYSEDQIATFTCGFKSISNYKAIIQGEEACIELSNHWGPTKAELFLNDVRSGRVTNSIEVLEDRYPSTGFQYEIEHVGECLRKGLKESPVIPHEKSVDLIKIMESLRKEWGL